MAKSIFTCIKDAKTFHLRRFFVPVEIKCLEGKTFCGNNDGNFITNITRLLSLLSVDMVIVGV